MGAAACSLAWPRRCAGPRALALARLPAWCWQCRQAWLLRAPLQDPQDLQGVWATELMASSEPPPQPQPQPHCRLPRTCTCSAGQEVSICYGAFPNEVFLLLFGFVPDDNPHDSVTLFSGAQELLQHCQAFTDRQRPGLLVEQQWRAAAELLAAGDGADGEEGAPPPQQQQLAITGQGFSPALLEGLQQVAAALQRAGAPLDAVQQALPVGPLVADRCAQLLHQLSGSLQQDEQLLQGAGSSANMQLAVRYRLNKQRVLQFAVQALQQ